MYGDNLQGIMRNVRKNLIIINGINVANDINCMNSMNNMNNIYSKHYCLICHQVSKVLHPLFALLEFCHEIIANECMSDYEHY